MTRTKAEAGRMVALKPELMADVVWCRWYMEEGYMVARRKIVAPFLRFVKQESSRWWY